jgi:hypothetical protein
MLSRCRASQMFYRILHFPSDSKGRFLSYLRTIAISYGACVNLSLLSPFGVDYGVRHGISPSEDEARNLENRPLIAHQKNSTGQSVTHGLI